MKKSKTAITTASAPNGTSPRAIKVMADSLNVRTEPNLIGAVIGHLKRGQIVKGLALSGDRYWVKIDDGNGLVGWASHRFLELDQPNVAVDNGDPVWLQIAAREVGVHEFTGTADNPRIVEYHRSTSLPGSLAEEDETAWCSSFVNWCVERAGLEGTNSAWARSWMNWGKPIASPNRGAITVFTRNGGGHVAFYISHTSTSIKVLGGNQSDAVNISSYPKSRLLGYRMPG